MSAGLSTGSKRQLTTAVASWGSAFWAWPAESMVATQVVRSWALYKGMAERRARAAASVGAWAQWGVVQGMGGEAGDGGGILGVLAHGFEVGAELARVDIGAAFEGGAR